MKNPFRKKQLEVSKSDLKKMQAQINDLKEDIHRMQDHYGNHLQAMHAHMHLLKLTLAALRGQHSDEEEFSESERLESFSAHQRRNMRH